jgi:hypothetical protein
MPFKSQAQRRFLFATNPAVAKEFAAATPKGAKLPDHVRNIARGLGKRRKPRNAQPPISGI